MTAAAAPSPWRLTARLAWRLSLVMVAALALATGIIAWRTLAMVDTIEAFQLEEFNRRAIPFIVTGADGAPSLTLPAALAAEMGDGDAHNGDPIWLIVDSANRVLASSDRAAAALVRPYLPTPPRNGLFHVPQLPDRPGRMVGFLTASGPWRLAVTDSYDVSSAYFNRLGRTFLLDAVTLVMPIGIIAVVVSLLTVRGGMRALQRTSDAAARLGPARAGVRLPEDDLPGEVVPLVRAVNAALERIEAALLAQRRFVADAAHTLRTPLAVLTARLDSLPAGPPFDGLRADADRMNRLVAQSLQIARLDGLPLAVDQVVDLHAAAAEAIAGLAPFALQRGIGLELQETAPVHRVLGNHAALVIALTNLIENAILHAPTGSAVEVELLAPAIIRVLDRGPGVPADQRSVVFERFHRGRDARATGAGLGLSIVSAIAAAHDGSVSIEDREGGGASFSFIVGTARPAASVRRPAPLRPAATARAWAAALPPAS